MKHVPLSELSIGESFSFSEGDPLDFFVEDFFNVHGCSECMFCTSDVCMSYSLPSFVKVWIYDK